MRENLDPRALHDLLRYERETGLLYWLARPETYFEDTAKRSKSGHAKWWNGRFAGKRACKTDGHRGYLRVCLFGVEHPAHRVVWAIEHGSWPAEAIDHINGDIADNKIGNLREASVAPGLRTAPGRPAVVPGPSEGPRGAKHTLTDAGRAALRTSMKPPADETDRMVDAARREAALFIRALGATHG